MLKLAVGIVGNGKEARVGSSVQHIDFKSHVNVTAQNALGDGECTRSGDSFKPMNACFERKMRKLAIGNVGNRKKAESSGKQTDFEDREQATAQKVLGDGECTLTADSFKPMNA